MRARRELLAARRIGLHQVYLTEREGFEPPRAFALPVFKTGAFSHSATSPSQRTVNWTINHTLTTAPAGRITLGSLRAPDSCLPNSVDASVVYPRSPSTTRKRAHLATLLVDGRTEYFYGNTKSKVLEKYNRRAAELQSPTHSITDAGADSASLSTGVPSETIEGNPEHRQVAKRSSLAAVKRWLDEHPARRLARHAENTRRARRGPPLIPRLPEAGMVTSSQRRSGRYG